LHLTREIEKSLSYEAIYQDIPLISPEDFENSVVTSLNVSEYQFMLNRLHYELSERQRMEEITVDLKAAKKELTIANQKLLEELEPLDIELDKILVACSGLKDALHIVTEAVPEAEDEGGREEGNQCF
jgi:hypothetical protein